MIIAAAEPWALRRSVVERLARISPTPLVVVPAQHDQRAETRVA